MRRNFRNQRGNIGIYTAVMLCAVLLLLAAAYTLALSAVTSSLAWDVRRQREIEARAVATATKEAILAVAETAPTPSANSLQAELATRLSAVSQPNVTISSSAANNSIAIPPNPQWPATSPVLISTPDFTSICGVGRNLQAYLSAGQIADLGSRTFVFTESNSAFPSETPTYQVLARFFSVPVTNFSWIAYGLPTSPGGVISTVPTAPTFARPAGFSSPVLNAYSGEAGTLPAMFGGMGNSLHDYYRDLASITWNAFEYWTSKSYQNALLAAAGPTATFDFNNPSTLPSGVTWDGTRATLNLGTTTASVIVFVDSTGGNILTINGAAANGNPVVVAIRNYSTTQTTVEIASTNSRTTLLYAQNCVVAPTNINFIFRGGILLFPNSTTGPNTLSVFGFVGYAQNSASPPNFTATPDAAAASGLSTIAPRALLVSVRGTLQ